MFIEDDYEAMAEQRDALARSAAKALCLGNKNGALHLARQASLYDDMISLWVRGPSAALEGRFKGTR